MGWIRCHATLYKRFEFSATKGVRHSFERYQASRSASKVDIGLAGFFSFFRHVRAKQQSVAPVMASGKQKSAQGWYVSM